MSNSQTTELDLLRQKIIDYSKIVEDLKMNNDQMLKKNLETYQKSYFSPYNFSVEKYEFDSKEKHILQQEITVLKAGNFFI